MYTCIYIYIYLYIYIYQPAFSDTSDGSPGFVPIMEKVFPLPVCPYAKQEALPDDDDDDDVYLYELQRESVINSILYMLPYKPAKKA
jgi:hypothetical protein